MTAFDVTHYTGEDPATMAREERVRLLLDLSRTEAEALAAARIARAGSDLLAADCKPVAHAAADALVAAGMGGG